ncbi:hypothetical protein MUK42_04640 [Musa troglodytarum]|uniref:Uncharacterized protein n=1 Tax=Musa troglodytarum TaxID=320322 RepID=A0A9E7GBN6_9LILI|nr:hypothetical protein MUK42_04640 [Musa troglodytarum]
MKPAVSVMFLLFLVLLLSANRSQGARVLEEESLAPPHRQVHVSGFSEKESLMKEESGRLMTNAMATSKVGIL